jgi:hypothetical protein
MRGALRDALGLLDVPIPSWCRPTRQQLDLSVHGMPVNMPRLDGFVME